MIKQPFRIGRKKKTQQSADPHIFELERGVLFQTIWTLAVSVSSGTPWVIEWEQLPVQMQMLSHQLKIARIIKFEKYNNSKSPLRTQSMTHHRQLPIPSPFLSRHRLRLETLLEQSTLSPNKSTLLLVWLSLFSVLADPPGVIMVFCILSQPTGPAKGGLTLAWKTKPSNLCGI